MNDLLLNVFIQGLGNLPLLSNAKTRSITAENLTGEKGKAAMAHEGTGQIAARELGPGWKISPSLNIKGNESVVLADIKGTGIIQHIWMTVAPEAWRRFVLRMYWDGEKTPSVEVPLGDFFCMGWGKRGLLSSLPVCVNSAGGFNSYWPMPFHKSARITLENLAPDPVDGFYFQITYALTDVPEQAGRFHAQFRRNNPLPYMEVHTLLEGVRGQGHYVGTYVAWQNNSSGWWGEGEMKFYLDGDKDYPTIAGTGTEDYFGGAWCFSQDNQYVTYSTPFLGFHQHIGEGPSHQPGQRFGLYRWHIMDPVRFEKDLRVTLQALGWRSPYKGLGRYLPLQDDIASTAFWYQTEPHAPFPKLPDANGLEVI